MTLLVMHPSNREQFALFDRVILMSTGRIAYQGPADQMHSYFARLNYSSPSYTSSIDYLADLLTLDASGQHAIYESGARIEQLLAIQSKQTATIRSFPSSEPWPSPIPRRAFFLTCLVLWL